MRELTFELTFEKGADPLMDVFIEYPSLSAEGMASCVQRDHLWRIERFVGPSDALDAVERHKVDPDTPREETTHTECEAIRENEILERSPTTLILYSFVKRLHMCDSVVALAARRLEMGIVFQMRRQENRHQWRLLMRSDENVDVFYEDAKAGLADGVTLNIGRLGTAERWNYDSLSGVSLPHAQRETLRAAIEHGYYERPRDTGVGELAELLDIPDSTVSYRLRQAEAQLAKGYLNRFGGGLDTE